MHTPKTLRRSRRRRPRSWGSIFGTGILLWTATVIVTFATGNTALIPTIVLLGSFLVPVTFVAWAFRHGHSENLTVERLFSAFVVGGVLGVLGASVVESLLVRPSPWMYVVVGLIEEAVKLLALLFVARGLTRRTVRDGLVLGATVGFGFAAFESSGYALNALITRHGLSLPALIETEILRGLLAPVGHGLWTAIIGGAVFAAVAHGRRIFTVGVLATYLGVSLLHALWDSMHGVAVVLALVLTEQPWREQLPRHGYPTEVTAEQVHLITVLDWGGLTVVSLAGIVWLFAAARVRGARSAPTAPVRR